MHRLGFVLLLALLVLVLAPVATAHGDGPRETGTIFLEPGASFALTRDVHWHRLMGTVDARGPVTVAVEGPVDRQTVAGPGAVLTLNHLIRCCDEATWTPHTVRITNAGAAPASVTYDLVLLHDNMAVTAHNAEAGAWWQTLAIILVVIAIPAWRARQPRIDGSSETWIEVSRTLHIAAWGTVAIPATFGMARFTTGPLAGSLGATASFPSGGDGFLNSHAYLMVGAMVIWGASLACWAGARRRAGSPRAHRIDGLLFAAGPVVVGALMVLEFGPVLVPLVLALVPAAALVADALWTRGSRTMGPEGPPAPRA